MNGSPLRIEAPARAGLYLCFDFHFDDSLRMSVWIDENTLTCFDLAFDLHYIFLSSVRVHTWTTTVRVHGSPTACFDIGFDLHVDPPINRYRPSELLHRF